MSVTVSPTTLVRILALTMALAGERAAAQAPPARAGTDPCADLGPLLDLGFESGAEGWFRREAEIDTTAAHDGKQSLRLQHAGGEGFAVATRTLPIERARGHSVRVSGWLRTAEVKDGYAGLWLRVDSGQE